MTDKVTFTPNKRYNKVYVFIEKNFIIMFVQKGGMFYILTYNNLNLTILGNIARNTNLRKLRKHVYIKYYILKR